MCLNIFHQHGVLVWYTVHIVAKNLDGKETSRVKLMKANSSQMPFHLPLANPSECEQACQHALDVNMMFPYTRNGLIMKSLDVGG